MSAQSFFQIRKIIFLLLIALLTVISLKTLAQDEPIAKAILFHSPTCPYCRITIQEILPPIQELYGNRFELRFYDLTIESDYLIFAALHEKNPQLPGGIPQLYIDQYVLVGTDEISQGLPVLIEACLEKSGCDWPFTVTASNSNTETSTNTTNETTPVYIAYCFDPSCLKCDKVEYDLEHLQRQYPQLVVRHFDIHNEASLIEAMCERYNVPSESRLIAPTIFIGEEYLIGEQISTESITTLIENASADVTPPWEGLGTKSLDTAVENIADRFRNFSIPAIAAAGLLDGINPCAFTTIIFFLSYLTLVGREKHELLRVGIAFTLAVFISYLGMGLGLSALVEQIGSAGIISKLIYGATALICFVLALLSLIDFIKVRQGKATEITLQLPKQLKQMIHGVIRTRSRMKGFVVAAFATGVIVSVFELACTGQVYLPTIVFMTSVAELRTTAIAYLILYNIMFVIPLMMVFLVAYFGISSQKVTEIFQSNLGIVKLFTAVLFALLGGWLAYMLLV